MSGEKFVHEEKRLKSKSPEIIIPYLMDWISPSSVVDVGCGLGNWLKVFKDQGVSDVLGIDGHHLDQSLVVLQESELLLQDLEKPILSERKFDLAISLEVAEHLKESSADTFIDSLIGLSDFIFFSAAIPYQGGQNHINEQPLGYWIEKFENRDYDVFDPLRHLIWNHTGIEPWYKQNAMIAVKKGVANAFEKKEILELVHPDLFRLRSGMLDNLLHGEMGIVQPFKLLIKSILKRFIS